MLSLKALAWTGILAIEGAIVLYQQQSRTKLLAAIHALAPLGAEMQRLEAENQQVAAEQPTESEIETIRRQHAELIALRSAVAPQATGTEKAAADEPRYPVTGTGSVFNPRHVGTADLKLKNEWKNAGTATASASFETFCWAERMGDIDVLLSTMAIDDDARAKAEEVFAGLTDEQRAKFGNPDQLIAALMVGSGTPFEAIKVLDENEGKPGEVVLHTLWQYSDGRIRENNSIVMRQTDDGWREPVSAQTVQSLINYRLKGEIPGAPTPAPAAAKAK
jgi:hypothetical protein